MKLGFVSCCIIVGALSTQSLQQLRILLEHLEKSPVHDPATAKFLKRFVRTRIQALETAITPSRIQQPSSTQ
jgi:hypothetical protein